jgi:predicted DNA-binding transcriptional regulator AlpA
VLVVSPVKQPASDNAVLKRGLNREEAAAYIGISTTKFDELVADGRMPQPKKTDARKVWDIRRLDAAFDALPGIGDADQWGEPSV